ncbi:MAG: hypothetical protein WCY34_05480 [Candidatus Omnitrophota bacterium]
MIIKKEGDIILFEYIVRSNDQYRANNIIQDEESIDLLQDVVLSNDGVEIDDYYWIMDINGNWTIYDHEKLFSKSDLEEKFIITKHQDYKLNS